MASSPLGPCRDPPILQASLLRLIGRPSGYISIQGGAAPGPTSVARAARTGATRPPPLVLCLYGPAQGHAILTVATVNLPVLHRSCQSWIILCPRVVGARPPVSAGPPSGALPALSTGLHDALEEHGVVLHVSVLGRMQPVEGEEERAAAGHVGFTLRPLEGR